LFRQSRRNDNALMAQVVNQKSLTSTTETWDQDGTKSVRLVENVENEFLRTVLKNFFADLFPLREINWKKLINIILKSSYSVFQM